MTEGAEGWHTTVSGLTLVAPRVARRGVFPAPQHTHNFSARVGSQSTSWLPGGLQMDGVKGKLSSPSAPQKLQSVCVYYVFPTVYHFCCYLLIPDFPSFLLVLLFCLKKFAVLHLEQVLLEMNSFLFI